MHGLSGGRRLARKRASSDPTPVNQPNKEGQPSAEVGEGRAETKENIVQPHMHPTQSGKRMRLRIFFRPSKAAEGARSRAIPTSSQGYAGFYISSHGSPRRLRWGHMKAIVDKLLRSTSSPRRLSKLLKAPVLPRSYSQP